jgi:DNA-binding transcriptional ArsR family regulator
VSKHLRVLAGAGLVRVRRAGRESICEIRHEQLQQAQRWLDDISRQWDGALSRLQRLVES